MTGTTPAPAATPPRQAHTRYVPPVPHTPNVPRRDAQLVTLPPDLEAGLGRIELHTAPHGIVADLDLAVCHTCHRGVIEHVRTDPPHRRRGHGRALVTAALRRGTGYAWSTTRVDTAGAAAFWAAVAPNLPHQPAYCAHMRRAAALEP